MLLKQDGAKLRERLRGRVVQSPDHRLALTDGERDVLPICGYGFFESLGGVGETAATQKVGEFEDVVVGDGQAGEPQRSAKDEGDDQYEHESGGRGPDLRAAGRIEKPRCYRRGGGCCSGRKPAACVPASLSSARAPGGSADALVGRFLTPSARSPSLAWVTYRVVCISHATGAGGEEVGRLVAERLGFLYVDDEIVARAAARGEISSDEVADEERRKSLVSRLLEALAEGSSEVGGSVVVQGLDTDDVRALIRETIERTAARGNAVIVAHAASYVLEPGDESLRVLVTASPSTRAKRLGAADAVELAKAARAVKESDAGRRDYLKRFYKIDEELPTHYDLVVNTDVLSVEQAADLVGRVASR